MKKVIILVVLVLALSGCSHAPNSTTTDTQGEVTIIEEKGEFKAVIPQPTSDIRGITETYTTSLDIDYMESGLMNISKYYLTPEDYYYVPGQVISAEDAIYLLGREYTDEQFEEVRKKDANAKNIGLNPPVSDLDSEEGQKYYVNTLIEQNYYTENSSGEAELDTIAIGFGITPSYEYTTDGETYTKEIPYEEIIEYATPYIADRMTSYLRSFDDLEDVNIIYGFFLQSDTESIPGRFYAHAYIPAGSDSVGEMQKIDSEYIVFPSEEGYDKDSDLNSNIEIVVEEINSYFSTYTGVNVIGHYFDGDLQNLTFSVIVNVYSRVDIVPFVSYVESLIYTYLDGIDIIVDIRNSKGDPVAIIVVENGDTFSYVY